MGKKPITLDFSDHDAAVKLFDEAFVHPRRHYVIQPVDVETAKKWLRKNASMRHFGWGPDPRPPMGCGDLMSMDTLYYRDRCGWVADCEEGDNNGYLCDYPPDEQSETCSQTGKRLCHTWQCPVAYEADREDIRRKDPGLWKSDYKPHPDEQPTDWMVLCARPRYAYVVNVTVLGCETVYQP